MKFDETYKEAGFWFKDNIFTLNNNFAITDQGILFYYNNYEIASYVYGPTKIFIPYDSIENLVKRKGMVYEIMPK
jgi:Protein of unknown function (DUF3298)